MPLLLFDFGSEWPSVWEAPNPKHTHTHEIFSVFSEFTLAGEGGLEER